MHIIVVGCGKVGSKLAQVLSEEGHDVVIVDNDRNSFKLLGADFRGITVTGVPIDQDVLRQAGIETADALMAVTPDDNVNIMACQVAKEIFKVPRVIARIYNPAREHVFHEFGLETICPTNITADAIKDRILGKAERTEHVIEGEVISFREEKVSKHDEGKKLGSVKPENGCLIFGVVKNGKLVLANPDIELDKGDVLVVAERLDLER